VPSSSDGGAPKRRAGEAPAAPGQTKPIVALRVPFVRRCELESENGAVVEAYMVNLSTVGAYVASGDDLDAAVGVGAMLRCRFQLPGNEQTLALRVMVVWVNRRQEHPVHSLPPGVGLRFIGLGIADTKRIAALVEDYVKRNPRAR
jgi:PilZ domain